jgi:uncharacterized DUF497 family protein
VHEEIILASGLGLTRFEWDPIKAKANLAKHGISFTAAVEALDDPFKLEELDEDYERTRVLCLHKGIVILFVVTTEPEEGVCRIISARRANRNEQTRYFKNRPVPPRQPPTR